MRPVNIDGVATEVKTTQHPSNGHETEPTFPQDMRAHLESHSATSKDGIPMDVAVYPKNEQNALCKKILLGAKAMHHFLWYEIEGREKPLEKFQETVTRQVSRESDATTWDRDMVKALHRTRFAGHKESVKSRSMLLEQSSDGLLSCDESPSGKARVFAYETIQKLYTAAVEYNFTYIRHYVNPFMPLAPSTDQFHSGDYPVVPVKPVYCTPFTINTLAVYKHLISIVDSLLSVLDTDVGNNVINIDIESPWLKELRSVESKVFQMAIVPSKVGLASRDILKEYETLEEDCESHARNAYGLIDLFYKSTKKLYNGIGSSVGYTWMLEVTESEY
uniref:AlNc14C6G911 protein n=1 Tax=Albugo laibachii Nc14 TaxID=890382 RepID=F0W1E2_9STRA|nr:AlNc14C6G911 [Albugo laibachii Nc14]|eukprot:CCA14870.1 AlNc14C6G911 [Albugo laibachii Nc14]